jgi:hypothetical protein
MLGTPGFASPEQIQGDDVDARADLFSLGCVLYLMTTGEPPFTGLDHMALRVAVVNDHPDSPQNLRSETPEAFSDLVMELLQKSPAARPQTAEEVAERIRRIETALDTGVLPIDARVTPVPRKRKPSTRRRWTYALAAVGALLMISASFYAGPGVYRIATNQGLLIIEAPDDDIQVEVTQRGEVVKIIDTATEASVTLKAGQYALVLKGAKPGLRLESNQITLFRGDRQIVHARLERNLVTSSPPIPPQAISVISDELEPPPLAEWLAGRPVITVASAGGGDFYSIDAALESAAPGEVVKVLDAGPHPAQLNVETQAAGLVSENGARIELEQWDLHRSDVRSQTPSEEAGSHVWLWGGILTCPKGFRLSGLEISPPPPPSYPSWRFALVINSAGDVVIESCRLLGEPNNKLPPKAEDRSRTDFRAIEVNMALDPSGQRKEVIVRECHLEGISVQGDVAQVLIRRNWLLRFGRYALTLPNETCDIIVSHNVVTANRGVWLAAREPAPNAGRAGECLIANNHLVTQASAITVPGARWSRRPGTLPLHRVRVVNNLICPPGGISAFEAGDMPSMRNTWNVGHNAYLQFPAQSASGSSSDFPRQATDRIVQNPAISLAPDDSKYLRIPAGGPLASGGAGGELPAFIGALPPGPVPAGGDWFSRLLARHLLALAQAPGNQQEAAGGAKRPRPLLDREFRDSRSAPFAREARSAVFDHFFENGRYVQVYKQDQPHGVATFPVLNFDQDIACEVVARVKGRETDGWGIFLIETEGNRRGVSVKLSRDGTVRMGGSYTNDSDFPGERPMPVTHKAVKRGDDDNTLLVVLRAGNLAVYVNSVAVFPAIKLEPAFKPGRVLLSSRPEWKEARVEFKHVTIWPAKDWLPP